MKLCDAMFKPLLQIISPIGYYPVIKHGFDLWPVLKPDALMADWTILVISSTFIVEHSLSSML